MKRFVLFVFIVGVLLSVKVMHGQSTDAPILVSPVNGAQSLPIVVSLKWNPVDSASSYIINIAFDSLFTRMAYEENSVNSTTKDVAGLSWGTKYYWRIAAIVNGTAGAWSSVRTFAIIVRTPLLLYPVNFAVNVPTKVKLKWEIIHNADYYVLEVSTSPGFSKYTYYGNVSDTVKQFDSLSVNTTYYWKLRAKNSNGYSEYTETFSFTTAINQTAALTLVSPSNGAQFQPVNITLLWNSVTAAQSYRIQVARDSLFSSLIYDNSAITGTSVQIYGLDYGTKYYWRGNAQTASGQTSFSQSYYFTTILPAPANLSGIQAGGGKIKLSWIDKSNNELGFIIERMSEADQRYSVIDSTAANITSFTDNNVKSGFTYKYRIKAFTKDAVSTYSNEVTVAAVTLAGGETSAPKNYSLFQNFPNPFNPSTTISYALPFVSSVKLSVYNVLGKVVKDYAASIENAGYHEISFDASFLPSGIYFYTLTAQKLSGSGEQFRSVKKMIVIK